MRGHGPLQIGVTSLAINLGLLCPPNRKHFTYEEIGGGHRAVVACFKPIQISGTFFPQDCEAGWSPLVLSPLLGRARAYIFFVIDFCAGTGLFNDINSGDCFDE